MTSAYAFVQETTRAGAPVHALALPSQHLKVQHLVLWPDDVPAVQEALRMAGLQLGLALQLDARDGDLVLLDRGLADQMSPQLIAAFTEGRPCIMLDGLRDGQSPPTARADAADRQSLRRQVRRQLLALPELRSLCRLPAARPEAPVPGLDSIWLGDTLNPLEAADADGESEAQLLRQLHRRRGDATAAPLRASYGPGADLHVDFAAARVHGDARALQRLRLHQTLPVLVPDLAPPLAPVETLPLGHALWELGVAGACLPLLQAPADWWHTPLLGQGATAAGEYTRVPRYLDVLRRLDAGPVTAAELRREGRVSLLDLRCVLQACLLLGLVRWGQPPIHQKPKSRDETAEPHN